MAGPARRSHAPLPRGVKQYAKQAWGGLYTFNPLNGYYRCEVY